MPGPPTTVTLKKIALGHGIQNYSCSSATAAAPDSKGALAVLYDITALYPGTPKTGLSAAAFAALTTTVLWTQPLPLNLVDTVAAAAGVVLPSKNYVATSSPFQAPADLVLGNLPPLRTLGHHYFDAAGIPNFDLFSIGLVANVVKLAGVNGPDSADKGPLNTGAVQWLELGDSAKGLSKGLSYVYRVVTAGGANEACSTTGDGFASVPYSAQYWFYG